MLVRHRNKKSSTVICNISWKENVLQITKSYNLLLPLFVWLKQSHYYYQCYCFLLLPPIDNAQSSFAGSWHPAQVKLWLTQFIRLNEHLVYKTWWKRSIFLELDITSYPLCNNHCSIRKSFKSTWFKMMDTIFLFLKIGNIKNILPIIHL